MNSENWTNRFIEGDYTGTTPEQMNIITQIKRAQAMGMPAQLIDVMVKQLGATSPYTFLDENRNVTNSYGESDREYVPQGKEAELFAALGGDLTIPPEMEKYQQYMRNRNQFSGIGDVLRAAEKWLFLGGRHPYMQGEEAMGRKGVSGHTVVSRTEPYQRLLDYYAK